MESFLYTNEQGLTESQHIDDAKMNALENSVSDDDDTLSTFIGTEEDHHQCFEDDNDDDEEDNISDADLLRYRMRTILEFKAMRQIKQNVVSKNFKYFITK